MAPGQLAADPESDPTTGSAADTTMTDAPPTTTTTTTTTTTKLPAATKSRTLATATLGSSSSTSSSSSPHSRYGYAYAHLEVRLEPQPEPELDALQARACVAAALRQFLGAAGSAVAVDVLRVGPGRRECWVRVPRGDLGALAAAATAWSGSVDDQYHNGGGGGAVRSSLVVRGCSDWLGALVGKRGERELWTS
ncbi:hypothetical protein GGR56DRAFT_678130 [Xylariaceae sp. FL0804]|nr:hypothetical protein GGR56DRAFT_678130 [Xylariaceae sp. FL0804]